MDSTGTRAAYDLFVIGAGSAGLALAKASAALGAKVGIADYVKPSPAGTKWGIGGTCVNVGCIPKKLFHTAGLAREAQKDFASFGYSTTSTHNWGQLVENVNNYIMGLNFGYRSELMVNPNITSYNLWASFVDPHTLSLTDFAGETQEVTATTIVVATGGRPIMNTFENCETLAISSDDIFWRKEPPGKTLVVGASYIGLECAGFLTSLGFDTTVMMRSIPLRGFDQSSAEWVVNAMKTLGTRFKEGVSPTRLEKEGDQIAVYIKEGDQEVRFDTFQTVLVAVGRKGLAGDIGLDKAGVDFDPKSGRVYTNASDQTNQAHIYALGDVAVDRPELTPVAILAGKLLAARLFGEQTQLMDYETIATTVFTPVEYGCVGLSEEAATEKYGAATVSYHSAFNPLEWSLRDSMDVLGYMKLVCHETQVVGIHFVGPNAGEVIQGLGLALKKGLTKQEFDLMVGIHPTVGEGFFGLTQIKQGQEGPELPSGC